MEDQMTELKATAHVSKSYVFEGTVYYTGKVTCYENDRYSWAQFTNITRLTERDAMLDALILRLDLMEQTSGVAYSDIEIEPSDLWGASDTRNGIPE
jgi:hypothetical protein